MKRLFITTDFEKAKNLYDNTLEENNSILKSKIDFEFKSLPKEYTFGSDFKIVVLMDDFQNWMDYGIDKVNDFVLYHSSSVDNIIMTITNSFSATHIQKGSHILGEFHDKVYRILFEENDKDKFNKILKILGFSDKQIQEKDTLESKLNFLHNCLTPDGLIKDEVTKSEWVILSEFATLQKATDGPFGDNYLTALRALRDKLLES